MIGRRSVLGGLAATLGAVTVFGGATEAFPPRDAAANRLHPTNQLGAFGHRQASRRIGHAIDYSRDLQGYASYPRAVQPQQPATVPVTPYQVIVTEEVGRNISAAQRDIARLKKAPAAAKDPEAQKSFEAIQKHLNAAAEQHATMMDCCNGEECDGEMLMKCCDAAIEELEKAKAENDKLMKRLYPEAAGPEASGEKPAAQN